MRQLLVFFILFCITLSLAKEFLREGNIQIPKDFSQFQTKKRLSEHKENLKKERKSVRKRHILEKRKVNRILKKSPEIPVNLSLGTAESLNCRLLGKLEYFPGWSLGWAASCLTDGDYTYLSGESEWGVILILKTNNPSQIERKGYLMTDAYWLQSLWKEGNLLYAVGEGENGGILVISDVTNPEKPRVLSSFVVPETSFYDVVVQGNYAHICDRRGFRIVNIASRPPATVGYLNYDNRCWQLAVSGSYAYVIEDWQSLNIINISNPTNPTPISQLSIPEEIWDCKVQGNYAFVCGEGFYVINIQNPSNPSIVAELEGVYGFTMEISDNYAYLAVEDEMFIIDISNPENPTLACHLRTEGEIGEEGDGLSVQNRMIYITGEECLFIYDASDFGPPVIGSLGIWEGTGLDIEGNFAYVTLPHSGRLQIINISNPTNPIEENSCYVDYLVWDVDVRNNYAYVVSVYMYTSGLAIVDVSDPQNPIVVGRCNFYGFPQGVYVSGSYAYVADGYGSLRIINISNPSSPYEVGSYGVPAREVFVQGNLAYVAGNDLYIINVSQPNNPQLIGTFTDWQDIYDIYVSGNYAYIVGYDENWRRAFGIIDVSNPQNPTLKSKLREIGNALFILGNYAYIAAWDGLKIIDISNPNNPQRVGIANGFGWNVWDVRVAISGANTYGYVIDNELKVIDLTDPTGGVFLAGEYEIEEGNAIRDVSVSGSFAYVASDSGFQIIRIVPRNNPQSVGKYYIPYGAYAIDVINSYAYVLSWDSLYIIDASNPVNPRRVSTYPGYFYNLKAKENFVYLISYDGLRILDVRNPNNPNPRGSYQPEYGWLYDLDIFGSYAYITGYNYSNNEGGFYIINVSNPDQPSLVRFVSISPDFYPTGITVFGKRLYLTGNIYPNALLKIYDITNPENPNLLGEYQDQEYLWYSEISVTTGGIPKKEYAFVTAGGKGLRVFDVTNPQNINLFGYYKPAYDDYQAVQAIGSYAYIGGGGGFSIIEALLPGYTVWQKMPEVTGQLSKKKVKGGGGITAMGENVYLILGNNTNDFMRYSITNGSWAVACSIPQGERNKKVKKGAYIVDDEEYVYVFKGGGTNEFYKYNPSSNSWSSLNRPNFTKGMKGGFACYVNYDGNKYIYAGSGANNNEWKKFNLNIGNWENATPQTLPCKKAKIGSSLTYDGEKKIYFLQGGGKKNYFWVCDLSAQTPTWVMLESLPLKAVSKNKKVKEGGCIEWFNGKVYAVKGGNTKEFWVYEPSKDTWQYIGEIGEATAGIKCGRSLTASEFASGIFCLIGNNTNELFFCTPFHNLGKELEGAIMGNTSKEKIGISAIHNPTKGLTKLCYHLPNKEVATLKIYNTLGNLIYSAKSNTGEFTIKKLPTGIYLLRFEAKDYKEDKKLVIIK